jgi:hypothetical protein
MPMSKVDLYAAIRRDSRTGAIDEILRADLDAPRKQRHTVNGSTTG